MESFTMFIDETCPSANAAWRHAGHWTYVTAKYRTFRTYVQGLLSTEYGLNLEKGTLIGDKPFIAEYRFQFKGKRKRDVSNYIKPLEDTLKGHLFDDDEQCYKIIATRAYEMPSDGVEIILYY